uniref:Uncharacterized protein n=1 Tax=Plectus sambesii TaxID=2011161 RepID=A0A914VC47_9BILA
MGFSIVIFLLAASQFSCGFLIWVPRPPNQEESPAIPNADYEEDVNSHPDINHAVEQGTLNIQKTINDSLQDVFQIFGKYQQRALDRGRSRNYGSQLQEAIVGLVLDQFLRQELSNGSVNDVNSTQLDEEKNDEAIAVFEISEVVSTSGDKEEISSTSTNQPNATVPETGGAAINASSVLDEIHTSTSLLPLLQRSKWFTVRIRADIAAVDRFDLNDTASATTSGGIHSSEGIVENVAGSRNESSDGDLPQTTSSAKLENVKELNDTMTTDGRRALTTDSENKEPKKLANFDDKWKFARESAMGEASEENAEINAADDEGEGADTEEKERMILRAHRFDTL